MKKIIGLLAFFFLLPVTTVSGQDTSLQKSVEAAKKGKMQMLMQEKLKFSNTLWEGIVRENFDMVKESAKKLKTIASEASWQSVETEEYLRHNRTFKLTLDEMLEQAGKGTVKNVALPYVRLSLNCMECHELVRSKVAKK